MPALFVSKQELNCEDIVNALYKSGIDANVLKNKSVVDGKKEYGCQVIFTNNKKSEVDTITQSWSLLQQTFQFGCAYVETNTFNGCVLDYLRPSICPNLSPAKKFNQKI